VVCGKAIAVSAVFVVVIQDSDAGPLSPPAGPVQSTMKTLEQIEPRVCINDLPGSATASHTISRAGNYYLRADVNGKVGLDGIEIDYASFPPGSSAEVTIDLNGYSLIGVPGSGNGISAVGSAATSESLRVGNHPNVVTFIGRWSGSGIATTSVENVRISNVAPSENGVDGIHLEESQYTTLVGIDAIGNGDDGIESRSSGLGPRYLICTSTHFIANGGGGGGGSGMELVLAAGTEHYVKITDFGMSRNVGPGMTVNFQDSVVGPADNGKTSLSMENGTVSDNGDDGVRIRVDRRHSVDMHASELVANGNTGDGISIEGDRSLSMDASIDMDDMSAGGNGGSGFSFKDIVARLVRCVTRRNTIDGGHSEFADVELVECSSTDNGNNGNWHFGGSLMISGSTFRANGQAGAGGDGTFVDRCAPIIRESDFSSNDGDGLHVSGHGGAIYLSGSTFDANGGHGMVSDAPVAFSGRVSMRESRASFNGGAG
jgi:hypothetical protein